MLRYLDEREDPDLYRMVKSFMIHGPCGVLKPHSVCMVDGVCSKMFPKGFSEETSLSVNGYPQYSRRDNGRTV